MAVDRVPPSLGARRVPERPTGRLARTAAMLTFFAVLLAWCWMLGVPNDTLQIFLWLWLATVAWNIQAEPRHHLHFLRDWWLPVAGLVVYFFSRGLTDELGLPVHWQMPITFDEWLGGGTTPTEHLQAAWCGDPCLRSSEPRWYDVLLTTVYATHFVAGLTLAAVLWMRDRVEWSKWMVRYLGINFAGLVIYVLYPMAPPWMASQEGLMGEVSRLTSRGWRDIGLERVNLILHGVGNPVAAMPSLHAGIAFLIALYAVQRLRSPLRWLLLAYPVVMSLTLVYYAEHYVIDVLAGALLAGLVLVGAEAWERRHGGWPLMRDEVEEQRPDETELVAQSSSSIDANAQVVRQLRTVNEE